MSQPTHKVSFPQGRSSGFGFVLLALQWLLFFYLIPISAQADDSSVYRTITRTYANSNYYEKGVLLSEKMTDGSNRTFTETTNTYTLKDCNDPVISCSGIIPRGNIRVGAK